MEKNRDEITNYKADIKDSKSKDTIITYDIDDVSTEGTGAEVSYVNGYISKSKINIYQCSGQASIIYTFKKDSIEVSETAYRYTTELMKVKDSTDFEIVYKENYAIDFDGNVLGKSVPNRIDIYNEFTKAVPFNLNQ